MKCSVGVAVIAVIVLLGSVLTMLGAVGLAFVYNSMNFSSAPTAQPLPPGWTPDTLRYFGFVVCAFLFALGGLGAATGVGLLQLWRWARYSIITFGALLSFFGLISGLMMLLIPLPVPDHNLLLGIRLGFTLFYGLWVALGVFFAVFFTRKKVVEQFRTAGVPTPPPLRPVSITVIAWLMIVSSVTIPFCIAMHYPAVLFGLVLTGQAASVVYLTYTVIYVAIGVGLLRFKPAALWSAVLIFVLGGLNALILMLPGPKARYLEIMKSFSSPAQPNPFIESGGFFVFAIGVGALTVGIPLYFLLTRRARFLHAAALVNSSTPTLPPATLA